MLFGSDWLKTNWQRKVEIKEMAKSHKRQNSNKKNARKSILISAKMQKC